MQEDQPEDAAREPLYLVHDSSLQEEVIAQLAEGASLTALPWSDRQTPPEESRVLLCLGDEQVREIALLAAERSWVVGVLPHREAPRAASVLGIKGNIREMFSHYLHREPVDVDVLTCNGEVVLSAVLLGRVASLRPADINRPQTVWSRLRGALTGLRELQLLPYRLTTGKGREVNVAALGLAVMGQARSTIMSHAFSEDLNVADGRLSMLAIAPRSILSYLLFLLKLLLPGTIKLSKLPHPLGLIQTAHLDIHAPLGTEYLLDGKPVHATDIEFRILDQRIRLLAGPGLQQRASKPTRETKESVRLNQVPVEEGARALLGKTLPLFSHATEEEHRDLFIALRDSATASDSYKVLMVLSVLLATTGLYANSAPVIIGAMILAPLMAPIVSLAMGLARTEYSLIIGSLRTLGIGIAWGVGCTLLFAWVIPLETPTLEMHARMSPNLLDLLVATISGVAGAYANARESIAKSLAGVAIAVALVPPLAVAGIGLGWGDWSMALSAGLLLLTNLVGISVAASATFLVLGFAPFKRARAGMGISLLLVLTVSLPLTLSFAHLVERDRILDNTPRGDMELGGVPVTVRQVRVSLGSPHVVRLVLSSPHALGIDQVDELKQIISERVGEPVLVEAQLNIRR